MKKVISVLLAAAITAFSMITGCAVESDAWKSNTGTVNLDTMKVTGSGVSVKDNVINIKSGGDFNVTGTWSNGMICIDSEEKVKLRLSGASVTNSTGPAIYFKNAKKAFITLTEDTENYLCDGADYLVEGADAALFSNDNLEIKGSRLLTIIGNYKHGIASDDDLEIKNGNITITAAEHGIKANDKLAVSGGSISVTAETGKGMKAVKELVIDDGTSDASHELRTPVAVILSECEYMEECAKSIDDYKESVCSVKRQAERMSRLISELLTISRMDKNTVRINSEQVDLSELLRFVCDEQEEINTGSSVMVKKIEQNVIASVDRDLMAQLFINLISNAYRYGGENGTVTVSLSQDSDNICFCVEDTGIGIDEKDINKIWERFYRADASRSADENGSMGLGLSIVKWIAEKHGGTVTAESRLGKDSKFTFIFPKNPQKI